MHPGCNPMHPGRNPMHPGCNPMHPGCNPMHPGCNPMHLTLEICVPSERWMPEQPMHTSEPKGSTAQSGGAASSPQSAQRRLACSC